MRKIRELKDFLLVDGPPGTGKTTLIAEIVLQELSRSNNTRILLTSQTNVALDNAIEQIDKVRFEAGVELSITRLGRIDDDCVAGDVRKYLLPLRIGEWKQEALRRSDHFLETWGAHRGIDQRGVEIGMLLEQLFLLNRKRSKIYNEEQTLKTLLRGFAGDGRLEAERHNNVSVDVDVPDAVEAARRT